MSAPLLQVDDLTIRFAGVETPAVDGVSLELAAGESLGLVGESGSGKTMTLLAVAGLLPGTAEVSGSVLLDGSEVLGVSPQRRHAAGRPPVGIVYQDASSALNPTLSVGFQIAQVVRAHEGGTMAAARRRAVELLEHVRVPDAAARAGHYPHQFSGGQRQRVMIALALSRRPRLLLADEPTTALDVTVQARILDLMIDLRERDGLSLLWVTHDLGVLAGIADRVAVMRDGRFVEQAPVDALFASPQEDYTRELLAAVPALPEGER